MRIPTIAPALAAVIAVSALAPLLVACNTTAGAGQDLSATGRAVTRGANNVKSAL